jgi:valyl-tRNA synthetase
MILSEFANACLRLDYDLWKKDPRNVNARYKQDYLPTARYKTTSKIIISEVRNILRITERTPDNFNSINIDNILLNFEVIDFNDSYIIEFCRNQSFKLVTDDKDIINKVEHSSLTIITSV